MNLKNKYYIRSFSLLNLLIQKYHGNSYNNIYLIEAYIKNKKHLVVYDNLSPLDIRNRLNNYRYDYLNVKIKEFIEDVDIIEQFASLYNEYKSEHPDKSNLDVITIIFDYKESRNNELSSMCA